MDLALGSITESFQKKIGLKHIVDLHSELREEFPEQVSLGQRFIRGSEWAPEKGLSKSSDHENLLKLESVHQDYVETGGWLAEKLIENSRVGRFRDPNEIMLQVYFSEHARGSVGKSSVCSRRLA